jgi:hypothetical protein
LRASNIKLKPDKCRFGDNEVDYLGFNISDKGTRPSRKKVEALAKLPPPHETRTLESFLFSINYYRSDIPRFGDLTVDLFEMVAKRESQISKHYNMHWQMLLF